MSLRGRRHGGGRKNELIFLTTAGPATTFDPKITGVDGVWFFDDGTALAAASGAEISKTFASEGLHRAVYRPASGGLAAITAIDATSDLTTAFGNIEKCSLTNVRVAGNQALLHLSYFPRATYLAIKNISDTAIIVGDLSQLSRVVTTLFCSNTTITGSLVDLPDGLESCYLIQDLYVAAASIAHLVNIRDLRIYSMGWLTTDVDTVINSMWAARAKYTCATPALQIGGTNQAPTGNVVAPEEGSDWHLDGATWIPLTSGAKIWDLAKNVNSEARTAAWTITYTGGSIAP